VAAKVLVLNTGPRKTKKYTEIKKKNEEKKKICEKKNNLKKLSYHSIEDSTKEALKDFKEKFEDNKLRRIRKQAENVKFI
jgi:hypothetical protein